MEADLVGYPEDLEPCVVEVLGTLLQHRTEKRASSSEQLRQHRWFDEADTAMVPPTPMQSRLQSFNSSYNGSEVGSEAMSLGSVAENYVFNEFDSTGMAAIEAAAANHENSSLEEKRLSFDGVTPTPHTPHTPMPPVNYDYRRRSSEPTLTISPLNMEVTPSKRRRFFASWRSNRRHSSPHGSGGGGSGDGGGDGGVAVGGRAGSKSERRLKADGTQKKSPWKRFKKALASPFHKKKSKRSSGQQHQGIESQTSNIGVLPSSKRPSKKGKRPSGGLTFEEKEAKSSGDGAGPAEPTTQGFSESPARLGRQASLDRTALAGLGITPSARDTLAEAAEVLEAATAEAFDQISPVQAPQSAFKAASPNVGVLPSKDAWEQEKQRRLAEQQAAPSHGTEEDLRALEAIIMGGSEGMSDQRAEAPAPVTPVVIVVDNAADEDEDGAGAERFVVSDAPAERVPTVTVTNPAFDRCEGEEGEDHPPTADAAPPSSSSSAPPPPPPPSYYQLQQQPQPQSHQHQLHQEEILVDGSTATPAIEAAATLLASPTIVVRDASPAAGSGKHNTATRPDGGRGSFEEVPLALKQRGKPSTWSGPESEGYSAKLAVQPGRSLRSSGKKSPEKRFTLVGSTAVEVLSPLASAEPYSAGSAHRRRLAHLRHEKEVARSAPSSPTTARKIQFSSEA